MLPGYDVAAWFMVVTTGKSPQPVVDRLHGELKRILAKPEVKEQIVKLSLLPMDTRSVAEMQAFVKSEIARWGKVVEAAGIKDRSSCNQKVGGKSCSCSFAAPRVVAAALAVIHVASGARRRLSEPAGHHDRAVGAGRRGRHRGRIIAPKLAERLGKPVIIENRAGAGSTLGTAIAVKAAPDGYTLGMPGSGSMAVGYAMYKLLPYDPSKDFAPMALVGRVPFVLIANNDLAVKTVPDLIAYAKANKLFYASGGPARRITSMPRCSRA